MGPAPPQSTPAAAIAAIQETLRSHGHVALFGAGPGRAQRFLDSIGCDAAIHDPCVDTPEDLPAEGPLVSLQLDACLHPWHLAHPDRTESPFGTVRPPQLVARVSDTRVMSLFECNAHVSPTRIWKDPADPLTFELGCPR